MTYEIAQGELHLYKRRLGVVEIEDATPVAPSVVKLKELLRRVTKRNVHREIDTGIAEGRESW